MSAESFNLPIIPTAQEIGACRVTGKRVYYSPPAIRETLRELAGDWRVVGPFSPTGPIEKRVYAV